MKKKPLQRSTRFALLLLGFELLFWSYLIISRSRYLDNYFVNDYQNTAMDFFNMLANLFSGHPYDNDANYPAMVFLILRILNHLVPVIPDGGSGFFLRNYMPAQLAYILLSLLTILSIWEIFRYFSNSIALENYLFSLSFILSGPFIFSVERGNFILLSYLFLLLFFSCYDSPKKSIRYLGYLALAFSASIKIYPALFGIIILGKVHWKEVFGAVALGITVFIAPFFAFDGIASVKAMLNGILLSSDLQGNIGMGYNFSFSNLLKILSAVLLFSIPVNDLLLRIIPFGLCMLIFLFNTERWKKIFAIALLCIWLPEFSYTYTLLFLTIPLFFFLKDTETESVLVRTIYSVLFLIIVSPLALPSLSCFDTPGVKFPLSAATLLINFSIISICIILIITGIFKFKEVHS